MSISPIQQVDVLKQKKQELIVAIEGLDATKRKDYLDKLEKQAETFLQEQLKAALAISQRAVTLAAIIGAITASIVGLLGTLAGKDIGLGIHYVALVPLLVCLIGALSRVAKATTPDRFFYAGTNPFLWIEDISTAKEFDTARAEQVALYAQSISENTFNLKGAQECMAAGLRWAGIGLTLFIGAEFVIMLSLFGKHGFPSLP
ncbi:hypothetical protein N2603_06785 [Bradyrhizobium huanghuaihaiense]|uniref:hypothetical protein n=1 Tax=Bradyrhizobium huanghuaihaiense TaxID=990078 RepID=UPI0021AAF8A7|nr:hypothetical protein [Bradyrhizobium sp. CB3035]UWU78160.1 hypothetical protein N2603_06785 [Bradyrhizobium sp. CB3035]